MKTLQSEPPSKKQSNFTTTKSFRISKEKTRSFGHPHHIISPIT
jgi:hypothetical protein